MDEIITLLTFLIFNIIVLSVSISNLANKNQNDTVLGIKIHIYNVRVINLLSLNIFFYVRVVLYEIKIVSIGIGTFYFIIFLGKCKKSHCVGHMYLLT